MTSSVRARQWQQTRLGQISVARPLSGLELLSIRGWKRPWQGSLGDAFGLIVPEAQRGLYARVGSAGTAVNQGELLLVPGHEHYQLEAPAGLTASVFRFEPELAPGVPGARPSHIRLLSLPQASELTGDVIADVSHGKLSEATAGLERLLGLLLGLPEPIGHAT